MKKSVAIIGAGPAGLALAAFMDNTRYDVTIYEKNKTAGRKFLVAGKGGFNLTHSNPLPDFMARYHPASFLSDAIASFTNDDLRNWLQDLEISTYIGSSGRVFPIKGTKPIEVLKAILKQLHDQGVKIEYQQEWTGWDKDDHLIFNKNEKVISDIHVFALGGGSWKITGSDGGWLDIFASQGIGTIPFRAANCAFQVEWPKEFIDKNEGKPLKNIVIHSDDKSQSGEAVITTFGLEGNAIYALTMEIQKQLMEKSMATIYLDLKPTFFREEMETRLRLSPHKKMTEKLKNDLNLSKTKIQLLKTYTTRQEFLDSSLITERIKRLPLEIKHAAPLDAAISTTGGIALSEVSTAYELNKMTSTYCIGEMLDWYAPTGGYLLQGCFSMGFFLAQQLNEKHA